MKINFNKQTLYTLITGVCVGAIIILGTLVLTGDMPWLKAAGVGTGAPNVNARYLDGYGTALATAAANKIYVSDGSGYIADGSVDAGAIVDGTITNSDINTSAAIAASKLSGVRETTLTCATIASSTTATACNSAKCCASGNPETLAKIAIDKGYIFCISSESIGYSSCNNWDGGAWVNSPDSKYYKSLYCCK